MPALYGELDENLWRERGYILSDTDTDLSPELSPLQDRDPADLAETGKSGIPDSDDISELTRESWEVSVNTIDLQIYNLPTCINIIYLYMPSGHEMCI